jgi:hypothetical protein
MEVEFYVANVAVTPFDWALMDAYRPPLRRTDRNPPSAGTIGHSNTTVAAGISISGADWWAASVSGGLGPMVSHDHMSVGD